MYVECWRCVELHLSVGCIMTVSGQSMIIVSTISTLSKIISTLSRTLIHNTAAFSAHQIMFIGRDGLLSFDKRTFILKV